MYGSETPINLTSSLERRQTGEWQYGCTLPNTTRWPYPKENGTCEWLWQVDSCLWVRVGGSDIRWLPGDEDDDGGQYDIHRFLNEYNATWRMLDSAPWQCTVDLESAGSHPDNGGCATIGGIKHRFASHRELEVLLWRSIQEHFGEALNAEKPQDDLPIRGQDWDGDRQWRRGWIDTDFRIRAGLPMRHERIVKNQPVRFTLYRGSDGHPYFTHEVQIYNTEGLDLQAVLTAEVSVEGAFFREDKLLLPVPVEGVAPVIYETIGAWGILTGAMERWERVGQYRVLWAQELEHPYTYVLRHTVRCGLWQEYEEASGANRQIPYAYIAKIIKHLAPDGYGPARKATIQKVRTYFQKHGYSTARSAKVSVDELIEKLASEGE